MAVNNIIKRIQNIMRQDAGINGDAQRIEQMTWMFFLKVYDTQEETWEYKDDNYKSIIPEDLRCRKWAVDETELLIRLNNDFNGNMAKIAPYFPKRSYKSVENKLIEISKKRLKIKK